MKPEGKQNDRGKLTSYVLKVFFLCNQRATTASLKSECVPKKIPLGTDPGPRKAMYDSCLKCAPFKAGEEPCAAGNGEDGSCNTAHGGCKRVVYTRILR